MSMLSVIVPVLNTEKYIGDCLESILSQSYRDIEVLVIDSGSTDGTLDIIHAIAERDSRITVMNICKKSYGAQVNFGVERAQGKYIAVVEADDILPQGAYELLVDKMEKTDADIVKGDYRFFITADNGTKIYNEIMLFEDTPELYGQVLNARRRTDILIKDLYLWKGIYSADFLRKNHILFNETPGAAMQDQGFLFQTLILAEKIIYLHEYVYHYRKDNDASSVYSTKGITYLADEYELIDKFLSGIDSNEREIYYPFFYLKLMNMVRTRYLLSAIKNREGNFPCEDVARICRLLKEGSERGYIGRDTRKQKDLFEIEFFIKSPEKYRLYTAEEISAEQRDVYLFIARLGAAEKIYILGSGKNEGMLRMIIEKNHLQVPVIRAEVDPEKIDRDKGVFDAFEMAEQYDGKSLYIICSSKAKYEIRNDLHDKYNVPYNNILFYELGTAHYLFWL